VPAGERQVSHPGTPPAELERLVAWNVLFATETLLFAKNWQAAAGRVTVWTDKDSAAVDELNSSAARAAEPAFFLQ